MDFNADHFALFDLSRRFRLDMAALEASYRELQAKVHPDRFTQAGEAERRRSLQWATRANEAYQTLKKPIPRARYLLSLAGYEVGAENNTAMPPEFLIEQMEWRESVSEAQSGRDIDALDALHVQILRKMNEGIERLGQELDEANDLNAAAESVRRLMFLEKLLFDIDEALAGLEG